MKKWIYILILGLSVYLSIMYQWDLGIQVLAAEICLVPVCIGEILLVHKKVSVQMNCRRDLLEQEEDGEIEVVLTNKSPLGIAVRVMFVCEYMAGGKKQKITQKAWLEPKKETMLSWHFVPEDCGEVKLGIEKITSYDFMGLFSLSRKRKEQAYVIVMPKPYPVNLCVTNRTRWFPVDGESYEKDRKGEDASEIYDVREYRAGDRMQKVHWKLSAREDTIYIKEFSYPLGAAVVFLLEEDKKKSRLIPEFLEAVISISMALQAEACPHYIAWKKKEEDSITRILIRKEEDLYEAIGELLKFKSDCLEADMEERYRYTYKNDTYAALLKLDTGMNFRANQEETIPIMHQGIKEFFVNQEIVV